MMVSPAEATANLRTNEPAQFWRAGEPLSAPHPPSDITPRQSEGERLSRSMHAARGEASPPSCTLAHVRSGSISTRDLKGRGRDEPQFEACVVKSRGEHLGPGLAFRNLLPLEPRISWNARAQVGLTRASPWPSPNRRRLSPVMPSKLRRL